MSKFSFGRAAEPGRPYPDRFYAAVGADGVLEIMVYGDIVDAATMKNLEYWGVSTDGMVSSVGVKKALDGAATASKIRVRINSPGGDAFEGMAIHSLLTSQSKPVEVFVDGIAASAASVIAMAGSVRTMGRSAMMMIHDAWAGCVGNARDMQKMAESLDKVDESICAAYADRTGISAEQIRALMDEETWLTAQDCVDQGFATAVVEPPPAEENAALAAARGFKVLARMKHVPAQLQAAPPAPAAAAPVVPSQAAAAAGADGDTGCQCDCEQCVEGNCSECSNPECEDENCKDCPMQSGSEASMEMARARQRLRERSLAAKTG